MKKTCGALAVSLITAMITTNAYALANENIAKVYFSPMGKMSECDLANKMIKQLNDPVLKKLRVSGKTCYLITDMYYYGYNYGYDKVDVNRNECLDKLNNCEEKLTSSSYQIRTQENYYKEQLDKSEEEKRQQIQDIQRKEYYLNQQRNSFNK